MSPKTINILKNIIDSLLAKNRDRWLFSVRFLTELLEILIFKIRPRGFSVVVELAVSSSFS